MPLPEYEGIALRAKDLPSTDKSPALTILPIVEESDATGEVAALYDYFRAHFGRPDVPGILKCFATHPPLLRHMMELSESLIFSDGYLCRRHKEMIATFVSTQNLCAYCADSHAYFLRIHGGSSEALCAIQDGNLLSSALTAAEQRLLAFAQEVNRSSHQIRQSDIDLVVSAGWSQLQLAEVVHITALFSTFNRVANAFGLEPQGLLALYDSEAGAASAKA